MNPLKLVFLTLLIFLPLSCNQKTTKQEIPSSKQKEPVILFELPSMDKVIVKKDIGYQNIADSTLKMDIYYPPDFEFQKENSSHHYCIWMFK